MNGPPIDWTGIEVLSFDCYGTLIDWEAGILASLRPILGPDAASDDALLEAYAEVEARLEAGPWRPYREILAASLTDICVRHGFAPGEEQMAGFGGSVAGWPAFADSRAALGQLRERFDLAVITNCDDDLFANSDERLGRPFRWVVTAEQARSYKPDPRNFELALERIGRPREAILHVAQSLYHDHQPARELGLRTAWIDRRHDRPGFGATPPAQVTPDVTAVDMTSFAKLALAAAP